MMVREISWPVALRSLVQAVVFIFAMSMAIFVELRWGIVLGMLLLSAEAIWATICGRGSARALTVGWISTALVWGLLIVQLEGFLAFEGYYFLVAWLMAGGILAAGQRIRDIPLQLHWRIIGLTWAFLASCLWLFGSYVENRSFGFHAAILGNLASLIACRVFFRLPGAAIQFVNTLILLLISLPLVDAILRPSYRLDTRPETGKRYYSYTVARKDPTSFARWWYHFRQQWNGLHRAIAVRDPQRVTPHILRPNTRGRIFESEVSINSLGFRGPEIELEKEDAYRIVALGESTTFGCTISAKGKPWPRLLERMLKDRLNLDRPVQVINAGVYGWTIWDHLRRMTKRILPLQPDMIISYHGYNGFRSLDAVVEIPQSKAPPWYVPRPLKLLADAEYRLKVMRFRRSRTAAVDLDFSSLGDPMETKYAQAYEDLVRIARTNEIHLVLANFSMAVNSRSNSEVIEFYRAGFPRVLDSIQANEIHSSIVAQLQQEHPEISVVDTHPGLDGKHGKFIDLVHFTQEGRQQLAERFFQAIKDIVAEDLARPSRGNHLRSQRRAP